MILKNEENYQVSVLELSYLVALQRMDDRRD